MRGYVRAAGLAVFVLAFFLQAITWKQSGPGPASEPGWLCALVAIMSVGAIFKAGVQTLTLQNILLSASGIVNPLVVIYLAFSFSPKFATLRLWLAVAIFACLVSSWVLFSLAKILPREGHVLWVLGIALIVGAGTTLRSRVSPQ
jgi:hypothetical protein